MRANCHEVSRTLYDAGRKGGAKGGAKPIVKTESKNLKEDEDSDRGTF